MPDVKIEISKGDMMNPEIIIKNSYDGTSQVHILSGAFRLVCSNGMIIGTTIDKYNYKHNVNNVNNCNTLNNVHTCNNLHTSNTLHNFIISINAVTPKNQMIIMISIS